LQSDVRIPHNQAPVYNFKREPWHPRVSKNYFDSETFTLVHHDNPHGIPTFVALVQEQNDNEDITHVIENMKCACNFTKHHEDSLDSKLLIKNTGSFLDDVHSKMVRAQQMP
jgi:hypothetical protein